MSLQDEIWRQYEGKGSGIKLSSVQKKGVNTELNLPVCVSQRRRGDGGNGTDRQRPTDIKPKMCRRPREVERGMRRMEEKKSKACLTHWLDESEVQIKSLI